MERPKERRALIGVLLLTAVVLSKETISQVYKWVDDEGNVHFSDKPQDAGKGQQVDVDSVNVMEGEDDLANSAAQNRERVIAQQERDEEAIRELATRPDPCAADVDRYRRLSGITLDKDGRPFYSYTTDENGEALSMSEHNELVASLKENLERRGCI